MARKSTPKPTKAKATTPDPKKAPAKRPAAKKVAAKPKQPAGGVAQLAGRRPSTSESPGSTPGARSKKAKPAPAAAAETPQTPWQKWSADPARAITALCDYIVSGGNLWAYSQEQGLSYSTIRDWIAADPERDAKYARAREDRSDKLADEIVSISDDDGSDLAEDEDGRPVTNHAAVQRAKLRVDARKWVAAKLKPRVYGDKVQVDATIDARSMSDDELAKRLARFGITAITPPKTEGAADGGD